MSSLLQSSKKQHCQCFYNLNIILRTENGRNVQNKRPLNIYHDRQTAAMIQQGDVTWTVQGKDGRNNFNSLGMKFSPHSLLWRRMEKKHYTAGCFLCFIWHEVNILIHSCQELLYKHKSSSYNLKHTYLYFWRHLWYEWLEWGPKLDSGSKHTEQSGDESDGAVTKITYHLLDDTAQSW